MKKTLTKVICLLLVAALIPISQFGCGSSPDNSPAATADSGQSKDSNDSGQSKDSNDSSQSKDSDDSASNEGNAGNSDGEVFEIEVWLHQTELLTGNQYVFQELESMLNVKFDFIQITADMKETVSLRIASGDLPDTLRDFTFVDYDAFYQQGLLVEAPIDMMREYAPRFVNYTETNGGANIWKYYEKDGKNYSMPILWTIGPNIVCMGYRQDMLNEAGISAFPTTLDELEAALQALRDTFDISPLGADGISNLSFVYGAFGVYQGLYHEKDGKVVYGSVEPEAKEALTVLNRWYAKGLIDPEFMIGTTELSREKWQASRLAVLSHAWYLFIPEPAFWGGWFYEDVKDIEGAVVEVARLPKGPGGKFGANQANPIVNSGLMFTKNLEGNPEKMKKYFEVFDSTFDTRVVDLLQFGVEGLTFNYNDTTGVEWIPPYDDPDERTAFGIGFNLYGIPGCFNDYKYLARWMTQPQYLEVRNNAEDMGYGQYDILSPLYRPVYNEKNESLKTLADTAHIDFIVGNRSLDEFDAFVAEWMQSGGEAVMQEAEECYSKLK